MIHSPLLNGQQPNGIEMQQNAATKKERQVGLDIIRSCAILFVITAHFFLHTSFNETTYHGFTMFVLGMMKSVFIINVPLFLILTGYLNINKRIDRNYYLSGVKVIVSYLLFSILTLLFRRYWLGEDILPIQYILKITDFSAIPYGWYIEMWIGLFLLTPFLNILWGGVGSRQHKNILLITLFLLTALPDFFNRYGLSLVPAYWELLYPITFFYIGAYIREYRPQVHSLKLCGCILLLSLINPLFNTLVMHNHTMVHITGSGNGIVGVPIATMIFILFYDKKIGNSTICNIFKRISLLSLDMYLCSYIFDALYYSYYNQHCFINHPNFGICFAVVTPAVFISSFLLSYIKHLAVKALKIRGSHANIL